MRQRILALFLFMMLILSFPIHADQYGRLVGVVTNVNHPIAGANIRVEGTRLGAAADIDGHFQLLTIPPGNHTVIASAVGFRTKRIIDVEVVSNRTTHLNIALESETVALEPVTVIFSKPPVDLEETSERVTVLGETARELPVRRADHMVLYQPGVILGPGGDPHVRGGRAGDITYVVDGMQVDDPVKGSRAANIGREGMQEVQFLTGTFDAEYGSSMSGVVNIVSREGGEQYHGSIEWESPHLNASPWREADLAGAGADAVRDPETGESLYQGTEVLKEQDPFIPSMGRFSGTLSGPVPFLEPVTFFLHGVHEAETEPMPWGDKWTRRITGKLAWPMGKNKLTAGFGFRGKSQQPYNHLWKYNPQGYNRRWEFNRRASLTWTQPLNRDFYYDITAGVNYRSLEWKVTRDWDDFVELAEGRDLFPSLMIQELPDYYPFAGSETISSDWSESFATTWSLSSKAYWQPSDRHQLKGGIDIRLEQLEYTEYLLNNVIPQGPTGYESEFDEELIELSAWVQDHNQWRRIVFNTGLRLDYIDPRAGRRVQTGLYIYEPGNPGPYPVNPEVGEQSEPIWQLSPRLGIGYQLSEQLSLHAAAGHFLKMPDYQVLYINLRDRRIRNPQPGAYGVPNLPAGDPTLDPERTWAYEVGLKGNLTERWGFRAIGFYKDISNLITVDDAFGLRDRRTWTNQEEARAYGGEFSLHRTFGDYWSVDANYTLSWTKSRYPWVHREGSYIIREHIWAPVDYDRRHSANVVFAWQAGRDQYPGLFGTSALSGVSLGLIASVASGLPYTPYSYEPVDDGYALLPGEPFSERMAPFVRIDLRFAKSFWSDPVRITPFVAIDNLFDRRNELFVDPVSGEALGTPASADLQNLPYDYLYNPEHLGEPQLIRAGVLVDF